MNMIQRALVVILAVVSGAAAQAPSTTLSHRLVCPDRTKYGEFGAGLACSNELMVVGAQEGDEAVFVYRNHGLSWRPVAHVRAQDWVPSGHFTGFWGTSVTISGSRFAVAAPNYGPTAFEVHGAVNVFRILPDNTVVREAEIIGNQTWGQLGYQLSMSGDRLAVVARRFVGPVGYQRQESTVFVHVRIAGVWVLEESLDVPGLRVEAIALHGERLALGVFSEGQPNYERVVIFERNQGVWTNSATILPPSNPTGFGAILALDDTRIVVGSSDYYGSVWIFEVQGWQFSPDQLRNWPANFAGGPVVLRGDYILTANPARSGSPGRQEPNSGLVLLHRYERSAPAGFRWWGELRFLNSSLPSSSNIRFGNSLAMNDASIVIGTTESRASVTGTQQWGSIEVLPLQPNNYTMELQQLSDRYRVLTHSGTPGDLFAWILSLDPANGYAAGQGAWYGLWVGFQEIFTQFSNAAPIGSFAPGYGPWLGILDSNGQSTFDVFASPSNPGLSGIIVYGVAVAVDPISGLVRDISRVASSPLLTPLY